MNNSKTKKPKTLAEALEEYFKTTFVGRTESTALRNRDAMRELEIFTGQRQLDKSWYMEWRAHCYGRWASSHAHNVMSKTHRFLNWLESMEYIEQNPRVKVGLPIIPITVKEKKPFTLEDYEAMKAASVGTVMHFLVILGWATGMRLSDCCLLQWGAVDMDKLEIATIQWKVKRLGHKAYIPFEPGSDLHQALLEKQKLPIQQSWPNIPDKGIFYVDPDLAVLYKRQMGNCFRDLQIKFNAVMKKAGITDKSFHCFRVALCTQLANSDVNTVLACSISGHRDPSIFLKYARVSTEARRAALNKARSV